MHIAYVLKRMLEQNGYKTEELAKASPEAVVVGVGEEKDVEAGESNTASSRRQKVKKEEKYMTDMKNKAVHFMPPAFWFVSVALSLFQYLNDMRSTAWEIAPIIA